MATMATEGIEEPHDHDVLAGRGNACNYHPGNEYFRSLVRKHKVAYVAAPKPEKGKFSRLIVDEIRARNPPGRFLKQDPLTKLWSDIGERKALDKTRQALREGAPTLLKEIVPGQEQQKGASKPAQPSQQDLSPKAAAAVEPEQAFDIDSADLEPYPAPVDQVPPPPIEPLPPLRVPDPAISMTTPIIENRRRIVPSDVGEPSLSPPRQTPSSLSSLPPDMITEAQRQTSAEMDALQRKLATMYTPESFEPTPINPSLQLKMQEATKITDETTPRNARHERSDSLELDKVFVGTEKSSKPLQKSSNTNMDELSQQLSNMSFSVGDFQEEGNMSHLFDDSHQQISKSGNKSMNMSSMGLTDMSMSSFGESTNLGNAGCMSTTSFSKVFEESDTL